MNVMVKHSCTNADRCLGLFLSTLEKKAYKKPSVQRDTLNKAFLLFERLKES